MRAVVLVGGEGTRLRPLTLSTPKQMLPIVDRPMVDHVLGHLHAHGIDDVVLSMGYRPDAFTAAYPDGVCAGVRLHYAVEPEPLGTGGAIRFAALDAGVDERFVVVNGDVLTDLDIGQLVRFHEARGAEATIALHRVDDPSAFGVVPTDAEGQVLAFIEKPPAAEAPTDLINAGTYVFEPSMLERIPAAAAAAKVSVERETFPAVVADGGLYAMDGRTYWIDAGTPNQYLQAQLDLLDGVRGRRLVGVSDQARIDSGATVERSVVGPGAVVERGAVVRDAALLAGVVVASGASVTASLVGPNAVIGPGCTLEELCVIGDRVEIPAQTHLRGVRCPDPVP